MIGWWEWALIILVVLIIFGAKRIPEIAKSLGRGIRSFKDEIQNTTDDEESHRDNNTTSE